MRKPESEGSKIFLDSSVLYAATLSAKGGSRRILEEAAERNLKLVITPYVLEEVRQSLQTKNPESTQKFDALLNQYQLSVIKNPSEKEVVQFISLRVVPENDAPILAGARKAGATHLLTLDKKHFLSPNTLEQVKGYFKISTPGDYIRKYF